MKRQSAVWIAGAFLASLSGAIHIAAAQPPTEKLLPLNVTKDKLTFDPKTVEIGASGAVHTGCGGAVVKIISRDKGVCRFSYTTDGCGPVFAYFRGEVPIDAGAITVENFNGGIRKSFPEKHLTLVRTAGPCVSVLVEGTSEFVTYSHGERRSEMEPRAGDRVKFRLRAFTSREFKDLVPGAAYNPTTEFVVGKGWPWLETAIEYMTVGDRRQIQVSAKLAAEVKQWLPEKHDSDVLYLELDLVSVERAK